MKNNRKQDELYAEIDTRLSILYGKYNETNLTDKQFSKEYFYLAEMLAKLIKEYTWNKTYNHLTNLNYHFLVKILNHNDYFKWDLTKELSEELKTFNLI